MESGNFQLWAKFMPSDPGKERERIGKRSDGRSWHPKFPRNCDSSLSNLASHHPAISKQIPGYPCLCLRKVVQRLDFFYRDLLYLYVRMVKKRKKVVALWPRTACIPTDTTRGWGEVCSEMLQDSRSKEADGCRS